MLTFCHAQTRYEIILKDEHFIYCFVLGGAEIISMDAFNKSETGNDFVIGITIIKVCLKVFCR